MSNSNCDCGFSCRSLAIISGIVIGVIAAILTFTAVITITPAFLWVLFGIAVGYLGVALLASSFENGRDCCRNLTRTLVGALGTVLTSLILLGVAFAATSVLGAIITGLLLFFFTLLLISVACLIRCRSNCQ